jgi:hypothetical protein
MDFFRFFLTIIPNAVVSAFKSLFILRVPVLPYMVPPYWPTYRVGEVFYVL